MQTQAGVFKAYDLRGVYGRDFDDELAYKLGLAYYSWRQKELTTDRQLSIVVGHDMRLSSPTLHESLIKGLLAAGANILDIGLSSTPTFYFATAELSADGGIMVSASHNPQEYNGFKIVRDHAKPVGENSGLLDLKELVLTSELLPNAQVGQCQKIENIVDRQIEHDLAIMGDLQLQPVKIVMDPANAMGGPYFEKLFAKFPQISLIHMNWQLDGSFPSHEADPFKPENIQPLSQMVIGQKADLGIATDGDADRIFFVDNLGKPLEPGIVRAIMAKLFLAEKPGAKIAYDIRPGKITEDTIVANGGQPVVARVGHSLIKATMLEQDVYFAGESSGHFFLNMADGCYEVPGIIALQLLAALSASGQTLAEFVSPYQKYYHSGEINRRVNDPIAKIKQIAEKYADGQPNFLDGVTITYPDFWFNVRASNTEPLLRLNLEAATPEVMAAKRDEILSLIAD
ncbi:MAG TPA: phosphomannomutase/phosphoglucomutase [bacterium]|nr:phosphomannomutase/phosphoglucomutase [bacterium]